MLKAIPLVVAASLVVVACGGSPAPAASAPAASAPVASAPAASAPAAEAPSTAAAPAASGGPSAQAGTGAGWADSQRDDFLQQCNSKMHAPDYCSCGFDQFRDAFKDGAPKDANDPRFATLAEHTKAACASKLPEDVIKAGFLTVCAENDKRKTAYCECAWSGLRKNLSVADFASDFQGPRFVDAKKAMVKTCKGKFPVDLAKADFMEVCTKDGTAKSCECIWKKVHAKFTAEEIVEGLVVRDQVPGLSECK
jgi:hypothetical protein